MNGFLMMDNRLVKVEAEGNTIFHCIICKSEYPTRIERNKHLETHFVHGNCKHCSRAVIVIGDLEFELHQPMHCKPIEHKNIFEEVYANDDDAQQNDDIKSEIVEEFRIQDENTDESVIEPSYKPATRSTAKINYTEEIVSDSEVKKMRPERKAKRKPGRKCKKTVTTIVKSNQQNNLNSDSERDKQVDECDEDDVIKEIDKAMKKRPNLPKTIPCSIDGCDVMVGSERTMKIHLHQVHGIKERNICPICSREFKANGNLKQHLETHSDYKRFICNFCGKGFHLPYNLKEHMNAHIGARPHICKTCGKNFGRSTLLRAHMRIHTGEKPYKCDVENCDRAYAYSADLKRHRRSIHGIITKTFPCPICSKVFYENKFLTKHLNVHRGPH